MTNKFKLFMGCFGNGITVCFDRFNSWFVVFSAVMEYGDYKKIAHISEDGKIKWYIKPGYTPENAVKEIEKTALNQKEKYDEWWNSLSDLKRYEITLDRMTASELVEHLKEKRA